MDVLEIVVISVAAGVGAALSSAIGLGGGVLLLAVMLGFMDPLEAVPIHAVMQVVANGSRGYVLRKAVASYALRPFLVLLVPGAVAGYFLARVTPTEAAQIGIALFALLASWWPAALAATTKILGSGRRAFLWLGAVSGVLQIPVGAVGPVIAPVVRRELGDRTTTVATFSVFQLLGHFIKLGVFVVAGFAWFDWWALCVFGSMGSIVGVWLGAKILKRESERTFGWLFRMGLTLVAIYVIGSVFASAL